MDNAAAQHLIKAVNQLTKATVHQNQIMIEFGRMWKEANDRQEAREEGGSQTDGDPDLGQTGDGDGQSKGEWPREGLD